MEVSDSFNQQDKRLLVPIVARTYRQMITPKIVSVQAFSTPASLFYTLSPANQFLEIVCAAKTKNLKTQYTIEEFSKNSTSFYNLDTEAEFSAILSTEIALENDREVLTDLRKNAIPMGKIKNLEKLATFHKEQLQIKSWNDLPIVPYRWLVTSPEIADRISKMRGYNAHERDFLPSVIERLSLGIERMGIFNDYHIYQDRLFPQNQVLAGLKFGKYGAGYIHMPYIALTPTPTTFHIGRRGFLMRYDKRLVNPNFYVKAEA
jgi:hypothetical protein